MSETATNSVFVLKPESDHKRGVYFWEHSDGPKRWLFCTHITQFTPHWCEVHEWATDHNPCSVCAGKETTMARKKKTQTEETTVTETAKTDPPPPPEHVRIEPYTSNQKCVLTAAEVADRADRAAQLVADIGAKEEELKAQQKHAKSIIETMEGELYRLSSEVRTKSTYRDVECERRYEYQTGRYVETRLDTGEVIFERPLTYAERQQELQLETDPTPDYEVSDEDEAAAE